MHCLLSTHNVATRIHTSVKHGPVEFAPWSHVRKCASTPRISAV